ncbi:MAG: hypothetical protein B7Y56_02980 [Gallionellales bacterium 35-53-114]|jgi:hypothetical protein|nr:MAG: hypothetical protein B7Y56_02980 [Gallionellales bacterium 35-53-114]OYZ65071.1 MAG: hypothetical protein B7Y04_00140 [Gallionellales bacterium 24-53-125]OZB07980.1 MAG: hypothetical protein B7X61_10590 [Gallionellales bacterium 39-52-133]HQS59720.1 hypothetical protein [Gallionellaceae bacterium]HQS76474.1 hypothetical protein [Gallionellaceae bacterium]
MSQHDMDIANQAGAATRADINLALVALAGMNYGPTAPAVTFAYMPWPDTTTGIFKQRNAANTAWISLFTMSNGDWLGSLATFLGTANSFTKGQRGTPVALTSSAASMAIDLSLANHFTHTTSENTTLAAPSNAVAGQSGLIVITQGATARTLAYNAFWKFAGGTVPTLTATIGAVDVFGYYVESASRATCSLLKDIK